MVNHDCGCGGRESGIDRRTLLRAIGAGAAAVAIGPTVAAAASGGAIAGGGVSGKKPAETVVKLLYDSLTPAQRKVVCFDWAYEAKDTGLLRTHISNNWRITPPAIKSDFYTPDQQRMIRDIFEGIVNPDWVERFDRQFTDDMEGFGVKQGVALFGEPGSGRFEFVLSGRHGTVRCDGDSAEHVAFGGPILYGHAAKGYFEKADHAGNVFWHQAQAANKLYQMLDGKQQKAALVDLSPDEASIAFRGKEEAFDGVAVSELSPDQREHLQGVLALLIEPYRASDRDEVVAALGKQGGLNACHLAYYADEDLGNDGVWDNWRLEGPSFVWHYRGAPHVHVWVNVSDDATVGLNAKNLSGPLHPKQ